MPCYDAQSAAMRDQEEKERKENPIEYAKKDIQLDIRRLSHDVESLDNLAKTFEKKCNTLTDMLCRCCKMFDALQETSENCMNHIPDEVVDWWKEHKKFDEERKIKNHKRIG